MDCKWIECVLELVGPAPLDCKWIECVAFQQIPAVGTRVQVP